MVSIRPIESWPLALCDARSLRPNDVVPCDLVYRDRVGETYGFTYSPTHRWYYFPRMERNDYGRSGPRHSRRSA